MQLSGLCLGQPGWARTIRNIHRITSVMVIDHPVSASSIYYDPWHPPSSIYVPDSLFHNLSPFSLVYLLAWHPPFHTPYIYFFILSLSCFRSTCPYHHNLLCCSIKIMSSNPSLSLSPLYLELYLVAQCPHNNNKNWWMWAEQHSTACMPLLMATSTHGLQRRHAKVLSSISHTVYVL